MTPNYKDEKSGKFIGMFRLDDKVESDKFLGEIGTIVRTAGWIDSFHGYAYWVTTPNGATFHLPECDLTLHKQELKSIVVAEADVPNKNQRIYSKETLEEAAKKFNARAPEGSVGQFGMQDGWHVDINKMSHVAKNLRMAGPFLVADISVMATPSGKHLSKMLDLSQAEFRMAGTGNISKDGVITDFTLISINMVNPDTAA